MVSSRFKLRTNSIFKVESNPLKIHILALKGGTKTESRLGAKRPRHADLHQRKQY